MPQNKFLHLLNGVLTSFTAINSSSGAGDADKIISTNSSGVIDITLLPTGISEPTKTVVASENISAGDFVNLYNNTGTPTIRKADASNGRPASGFVLSAVTSSQSGTVYFRGLNTAVTGQTPGATVYLSAATPGASTATAPSTTGQIYQNIGTAISATQILFEADPYIQL